MQRAGTRHGDSSSRHRQRHRRGRWTQLEGVPAGTTIGHVHLHVGSLEMAESFYHRALGFDKTVWNYPGALFMAAEGYHHHLGTNVWPLDPRLPPTKHNWWNGNSSYRHAMISLQPATAFARRVTK
jgi:catechol-2,3-dioxygenase